MCVIVRQSVCLVYLHTQLILFQKQLQYKPIESASLPGADITVPMVEKDFTFNEDHKLFGYVLSFFNVLLIL